MLTTQNQPPTLAASFAIEGTTTAMMIDGCVYLMCSKHQPQCLWLHDKMFAGMQLIQETVVGTVGLLRNFFGSVRRSRLRLEGVLTELPSALYMSQHSASYYSVRKDLSMATSQPKLLQAETLHDRKNHKFLCGETGVVMFMLAGRAGRSFSHPLLVWTDWNLLRIDFGACPSNSREAENWTS